MERQNLPEGVAVKVAQVPVVYHVPPLMMQPFVFPPLVTGRVPLPEKGIPGVGVEVGGEVVAVVRVVEGGRVAVLGRYLMPVAGQSDLEPSGGKDMISWVLSVEEEGTCMGTEG